MHSASPLLRTLDAALSRSSWFSSLPGGLRESLISGSAVANVAAGRVFCAQGAVPDVWLAVVRGALRLGISDSAGRLVTLDLLEPGEWCGDVPLLASAPLPYSIQAVVPSTVLLMRANTLRRIEQAHPELPRALARLNWHRAARLAEQMQIGPEVRLEERLMLQLRVLARRFGQAAGDGFVRIEVPFSQSELAQLTRASRQRVNEALGELRRSGQVRYHGRLLDVADGQRRSTAAPRFSEVLRACCPGGR